jgi:hypothetical protein
VREIRSRAKGRKLREIEASRQKYLEAIRQAAPRRADRTFAG